MMALPPIRHFGSGAGRVQGALYRETLQTTGCYVDRIVIVPTAFAPRRLLRPLRRRIPGALSMRFFRHRGIYRPDVGFFQNQTWAGVVLPPASSSYPGPRTRREDHVLLIVPMSSGRLFLDRVARQQSPSPLHRHAQTNMRFFWAPANRTFLLCRKEDISTLP